MQVSGLAARLKQAEKDAALYNSREALFGKPTTDYNEVKKLWESFEPYQQFWSIAAAWKVCACPKPPICTPTDLKLHACFAAWCFDHGVTLTLIS